jgi:hypothetical protein
VAGLGFWVFRTNNRNGVAARSTTTPAGCVGCHRPRRPGAGRLLRHDRRGTLTSDHARIGGFGRMDRPHRAQTLQGCGAGRRSVERRLPRPHRVLPRQHPRAHRIAFGFSHPEALVSLARLTLGGYPPATHQQTLRYPRERQSGLEGLHDRARSLTPGQSGLSFASSSASGLVEMLEQPRQVRRAPQRSPRWNLWHRRVPHGVGFHQQGTFLAQGDVPADEGEGSGGSLGA